MHPSLEQLQKILKLEAQNGYPNTAVIGGLPKMLVFWEPPARRAGIDAAVIDGLVTRIRAYPETPVAERAASVEAMLALIQSAPAPATTLASARPPQRPPQPERKASPPPPVAPKREAPRPVEPRPSPQPAPKPTPLKAEEQVEALAESAAPPIPEAPPPPLANGPAPAPQRSAPKPAEPRPTHPHRFNDVHGGEEPLDPRPRRAAGPRPLKTQTPLDTNAGVDAPLTVLHGIGPETATKYEKLGIATLRDMLLHFPRRYDDYSQMKTIHRLEYGEECSVIGTIVEAKERRIRGGQGTHLKIVLSDTTGQMEVSFFNQTWLKAQLTVDKQVVIAGRVDQYLGRRILVPKDWEFLDRELLHTGRIVPVYRLTQGIGSKEMRRVTAQVVNYWARKQPDGLPAEMVTRNELMPYGETLAQIHYPDSATKLAEAQHRLAFDELLLLQIGVLRQKHDWQTATGQALAAPDEWWQSFFGGLPYALTAAQQRALADIRADLARPVPMNRLLQGDVGSGKTAVAAAAMALAVHAGAQAAIMAPTSILAEQHYKTIGALLAGESAEQKAEGSQQKIAGRIRLLQGSTSASEKAEIYAGLKAGDVKLVIGTHALIEAPVEFANLGVVVIDEQHRFGVAQRALLRGKGGPRSPHLLVMTATPIPRSLALTMYGDLDLSVLDEMPPGRQPITTHILHANERESAYAFIRRQVQQGRQAFVVVPLVEESEKIDAKAAVEEHARLQTEVFRELKVGLLHGRLKPDEKEDVMARFRAGEFHILVSTSVVEVGVDIPNASVILIEGANRFGLAQLHQFRGRVGRGAHASYCLLASDAPNAQVDERLEAMAQSQDGFFLAEKDLQLRGPGDFIGTRQAGYAGLSMARLSDMPTIEKARREARRLFEVDPDLRAPEHQAIAQQLAQFWTEGAGDVS